MVYSSQRAKVQHPLTTPLSEMSTVKYASRFVPIVSMRRMAENHVTRLRSVSGCYFVFPVLGAALVTNPVRVLRISSLPKESTTTLRHFLKNQQLN
jgi:hypothetical protein